MNHVRRLYFELSTGKMILMLATDADGDLPSVEDDFLMHSILHPYKAKAGMVGVVEWDQRDDNLEKRLKDASAVNVDMSTDPPSLVFDYEWPETRKTAQVFINNSEVLQDESKWPSGA